MYSKHKRHAGVTITWNITGNEAAVLMPCVAVVV